MHQPRREEEKEEKERSMPPTSLKRRGANPGEKLVSGLSSLHFLTFFHIMKHEKGMGEE
jgi:hypothetical protein